MTSPAWRERAACIGKPREWWFPIVGGADCYTRGKAVCAGCPVILECRAEHARAERELGMQLPGLWGGEIRERGTRMLNRRADKTRRCGVCGNALTDRGMGVLPRFCGSNCLNRAAYRRSRGAPESDLDFSIWKARGTLGVQARGATIRAENEAAPSAALTATRGLDRTPGLEVIGPMAERTTPEATAV